MSKTMKVWRDNKIDQEEDIPVADLFARFQQSAWASRDDLPYERLVRGFLAETEKVSYETNDATTDALWDLIDMVREANR